MTTNEKWVGNPIRGERDFKYFPIQTEPSVDEVQRLPGMPNMGNHWIGRGDYFASNYYGLCAFHLDQARINYVHVLPAHERIAVAD